MRRPIRRSAAIISLLLLVLNPLLAQNPKTPAGKNASGEQAVDKSTDKAKLAQSDSGPEIRVALTTEANNVAIGSAGEIDLQDGPTDVGWTVDPDTLHLRVQEPHIIMVRAPNSKTFHVHLAASTERAAAERLAAKLSKKYGEDVATEYNSATKTYEVHAGSFSNQKSAEALRRQLAQDGYEDAEVVLEKEKATAASKPSVARVPHVRVTSNDGTEVLTATKPVIISPNTHSHSALTYNGAPYRGRFEILLAPHQQMTVVNVLPLEDYLRGVVPSEMGANDSHRLEALKAQAVAARTYAIYHRGQHKSEGFDVFATAASQVYGGIGKETELSDRAVSETHAIVAYYGNEPIEAYYSSTCGGHTENVENVFGGAAVPYLRGVSCSIESRDLNKYTIATRRSGAQDVPGYDLLPQQDAVTLKLAGFDLGRSLTADNFQSPAARRELQDWLDRASASTNSEVVDTTTGSRIRPRRAPDVKEDLNDIGWFAHWLIKSFYGESHPGLLLSPADASYIIGPVDSGQIPAEHLAEVAFLLKAGILLPDDDGLLHAQKPITRERALIAIARVLQQANASLFEHGIAAPSMERTLTLRGEQKGTISIPVSETAYLFRQFNNNFYPTTKVQLIGGEKVRYHIGRDGEIDFLSVAPSESGASTDRDSAYSHWASSLTRAELQSRLRQAKYDVGELIDIVPLEVSPTHRVLSLKIVGRHQTMTISPGNKVRNALGLRDSLFVIERDYNSEHQVSVFRFTGRGWGHGVGMCQYGAYGLALEGYNYEDILKHYYTGITLRRSY